MQSNKLLESRFIHLVISWQMNQMGQIKDLCIDKFANCPTHPEFLLEFICTDRLCIEPLCRRCVPDHREVHQQMGTMDNIKEIAVVKAQYLRKQSRIHNKPGSINPLRVNEIIKKMVGNYFRNKNEEIDGVGAFNLSEMKGLLDLMVQQGRVEIPVGFRERLYEFLRSNLILNNE